MTDRHAFHASMAALLQHMRIKPPDNPGDDAYELQFSDGGSIYFTSFEAGTLDLVAEAGTLPDQTQASIAVHLLALNQLESGRTLINVGITRDRGAFSCARAWT